MCIFGMNSFVGGGSLWTESNPKWSLLLVYVCWEKTEL